MVRLRAKLTGAAGAIKGVFGIKSEQDPAVVKLEALQVHNLELPATGHASSVVSKTRPRRRLHPPAGVEPLN